ncbi:MAG: undecaprenyl/decaprenyl-phosphate alpha-N-acetylglucosaminyl 1-phosphate transferase [Peptococcaceae bacterium]|nr:undecaprenyl/decaprenyl-phosphate alpha-N-acetylglucosaminyl 1-phosphate transferase [Peptococcaceae bacterium]
MEKLVLPLLLALTLGLVSTPFVIRMAHRWNAVDFPDSRKVHRQPMPRLGGLAVYIAFAATLLLTQDLSREIYGLLLGATLIVLLGILDDIRGISARQKLLGQIVAASAVIPFGLQVEFITNPLQGGLITLGFWGIPITVFWLVSVTNAVNLVDGLDGLAAGTGVIASITLAVIAWIEGQVPAFILACILAAATLGFLPYNFHPARVFLGDTGSMFLGFTLAATAVLGLTKSAMALSVIIPVVILGIPLFDTAFAVLRRYRKRRPIFYPDREHLHHRLLMAGLSHRGAVLAVYTVNLVLGASAVLVTMLSSDQAVALLVIVAFVLLVVANRVGILEEPLPGQKESAEDLEGYKRTGM